MKTNKSPFYLFKWYLDTVDTHTGAGIIGYVGELRWRGLGTHYTSLLYWNEKGERSFQSSIRRINYPECNDHSLTWKNERLQVSGSWQGEDAGIEANLFQIEEGGLDWNCTFPKTQSEIFLKNDKKLNGLGYAEQLTLRVRPWKIPMEDLKWGRFLSENETIIWIERKGAEHKRWIFFNGKEVDGIIRSNDKIEIIEKNCTLRMTDKMIIEEGSGIAKVVAKVLSFIPGFEKVIPSSFLNAHETKWRSRGELSFPNGKISEGWVIHEQVIFR